MNHDNCRRIQKESGFTLIELLIVVAIIGILAAIAIPNLLEAMHRSRQKRTMADIRQIALVWELYETDHGSYYPPAYTPMPENVPVQNLKRALEPTYSRVLPLQDGWGFDFAFRTGGTGSSTTGYQIVSFGRNGVAEENVDGLTTNYDCDIVYEAGGFLVYPANIPGHNGN